MLFFVKLIYHEYLYNMSFCLCDMNHQHYGFVELEGEQFLLWRRNGLHRSSNQVLDCKLYGEDEHRKPCHVFWHPCLFKFFKSLLFTNRGRKWSGN